MAYGELEPIVRFSECFGFLINCDSSAWYQSLGIRIPRELGVGYLSPLGWFDVEYRYMET